VRHFVLGAFLIFYAAMLTPAYFEPGDIVVSSLWITAAHAAYGDLALVLVPLWMATGYVTLLWGVIFTAHSLSKYIPFLKSIHVHTSFIKNHPVKVTALIFGMSLGVTIYLLHMTGQLGGIV